MSNQNKTSRKYIVVVILVLCGLSCIGQTTTVTATITDSDSQTWNNGTWQATLYNPQYPNGPFYVDGTKLTNSQIQLSGTMSGSGVISTTLYDVVNHITPGGTYYQIQLCPEASSPCAPVVGASPTGSSINLSTTLSAGLVGPRFPATGANAYGYSVTEIYPLPVPGGSFFNTTSNCRQQWIGTSWSTCNYSIKEVATRAETTFNINTSFTWIMSVSYHLARANIAANSMQIVFGNYYIPANTNVETSPGTAAVKMSLEYPIGTTPTLCTFSGVSTISLAGLATNISNTCNPSTIPIGAMFRIRILYVNAAGIIFNNGATNHYSATYDGVSYGTGTPSDLTQSTTLPTQNSGIQLMPVAIVAPTNNPSVCIIGDSRVFGNIETVTDVTGDVGEVVRAVGPKFGYIKMGVPGTQASQFVTNSTLRQSLIKNYCTAVIDEYGINDLNTGAGNETPAQVSAFRTQIAGFWTQPTYGTTLPSEATSTDSWATTTNQTITVNASTFNALVRAGISGEVGVFDVESAVDPVAINKWPVSVIPGATTGSANFATTDGIHETSTMNQIIAQYLSGPMSWISTY